MVATSQREWIVVGAGFAVVVLVVALWLAVDRHPPQWDYANHLERVVRCAHDVTAGDVSTILERSSFYPPLVPCAAALVYRLAPSDVVAGQSVILLCLGIGMAATYLLGRHLADGTIGVVAALAFAGAPFVIFSTVRFQLDLPLAAMVALSLYAMLRTDGFSRLGWSLATGVIMGLGLLTKPPFAAYVFPPLAVVLARVRSRRAGLNMVLAGAVIAALSLPWYGPRLFGLPFQIGSRSFKLAAGEQQPGVLTWASLSFYPRWFVTQFGVLAVVLFVVGVVVAVRRRQWFVLAALLPPLVLFEMLQNKNLRYTLPLLPVAAVVAGMALMTLPHRARWLGVAALAGAGAIQLGGTTFGIPAVWNLPGVGLPWAFDSRPVTRDWKHREILGLVARHSRNAPVTVSVVPNVDVFSVSNFRYYALRDGRPFRFERAWDEAPVGVDYMVLKTGDQGPSWTTAKPRRISERLAGDPYLARVFPVVGEFPLPDGSTAVVRARTIPRLEGVPPGALAEAIGNGIRRAAADFARDVQSLGLTLDYDDAIQRGHVRRLTLTAAAAIVGELWRRDAATLGLRDVKIVVDDVVVNPFSAWFAGRFDLLDAGRLSIERATITAGEIHAFLGGLKGFKNASVVLEDGALRIALRGSRLNLSARVRILSALDRPFVLAAEDVRVAHVPVPSLLATWVIRNFDPSPRLAARLPFPVSLARVTITTDAVRITSAEGEVGGR